MFVHTAKIATICLIRPTADQHVRANDEPAHYRRPDTFLWRGPGVDFINPFRQKFTDKTTKCQLQVL
jgi:hypothetical protein